jgi:hypothetical protein
MNQVERRASAAASGGVDEPVTGGGATVVAGVVGDDGGEFADRCSGDQPVGDGEAGRREGRAA